MIQSRKQQRTLRRALKHCDVEAATLLLSHSIVLGHRRLAVRRYFAARFLGAKDLHAQKAFCAAVAHQMTPEALLSSANAVAHELRLSVYINDVINELIVA